MYKKIILIILIVIALFAFSQENDEYNIYIPDISEIPMEYELFPPKYLYIETGLNSNHAFSLYSDYLNNNDSLHLFIYYFNSNKNFSKMSFNKEFINNKYFTYNTFGYFNKKEDSINISHFNISNNLMYKYQNNTFNIVLNTQLLNIEDFNFSYRTEILYNYKYFTLKSKWQSKELENNHLRFSITNNNFTAGVNYYKYFYPYIYYINNQKYYSLKIVSDIEKFYTINSFPLLYSEQLNTNNYNENSVIMNTFSVLTNYSQINAKIYFPISDSAYFPQDSIYIDLSLLLHKHFQYLYIDVQYNYINNPIYNGSYIENNIDLIPNHPINLFFNTKHYIHTQNTILSFFLGLGNNEVKILSGIKNIFNNNDLLNNYYSPNRTYFINMAFTPIL